MRDTMFHRGPDAAGVAIEGNVGLGHRRLSIIDLSGGGQPMSNEDGSILLVYNGEIYNFPSLKEDLQRRGHTFRTKSDTETIIHLYEEYGDSCPNHLNGMFAFALWDRKEKKLFLVRDRLGIKPLYYTETKEAFLFSSEIKALLANPLVNAEFDDSRLAEYLTFRHTTDADTLFRNIVQLPPGHRMSITREGKRITPFWSAFSSGEMLQCSFNEAVDELDELLKDAVKIRLISDVPLGTFCSGGVDSSLVTAMASLEAGHNLNTFSVGFHEKEFDETHYARIVSRKYETNHHEIVVSNKDFSAMLPEMIRFHDEPLNFANSIQIYAISKLAKEHVTVVLTGEGADELFAGYPRYQIPRLLGYYDLFPTVLKKVAKNTSLFSKDHRVAKLRHASFLSAEDRLLFNAGFLDRDYVATLLRIGSPLAFPYRQSLIEKALESSADPLKSLSLLDIHTYLASILNRQDKMSMAASIESRVPILDYRIAEFSQKIPSRFKVCGLGGKKVLKKVAERYLPKEVIYRKKSGFGIPLDAWFREELGLGGRLDQIAADGWLHTFIDRQKIETIITEHKLGRSNHAETLWPLLNLVLWKQCYFGTG